MRIDRDSMAAPARSADQLVTPLIVGLGTQKIALTEEISGKLFHKHFVMFKRFTGFHVGNRARNRLRWLGDELELAAKVRARANTQSFRGHGGNGLHLARDHVDITLGDRRAFQFEDCQTISPQLLELKTPVRVGQNIAGKRSRAVSKPPVVPAGGKCARVWRTTARSA